VYRDNLLDDDTLFEFLYGQARRRLAKAIAGLNKQERVVITLCHYEELSLDQIATILVISRARASELYDSGIVNIRVRLGDDPVGEWKQTIHTSTRAPTRNSTSPKKSDTQT
jgi:DNA-directed RNA polymerase specialized sigma24 family protein